MIAPISHHDFAVAFGIHDGILYERFVERLSDQLEHILHPSSEIENMAVANTFMDAGNNIHCVIKGSVSAFGSEAQIGGEIVYLKRSGSFRGTLWSTLANPSDIELFALARENFRNDKFAEADRYLRAVRHRELLPASSHSLRKLLLKRIGETARLSNDSLEKDWLHPDEEDAWTHLQDS